MRIFEGLQDVPVRRVERQVHDFRYDRPKKDLDGNLTIVRGDDHQEIRWEATFVSALGLPEVKQVLVTIDAEPPPTRQWNGVSYHLLRYDTQNLRIWYGRKD